MNTVVLTVSPTVARIGSTRPKQRQITIAGAPVEGTSQSPKLITVKAKGKGYSLVLGDTHGIHASHQTGVTVEGFDRIYTALAKVAGARVSFEWVGSEPLPPIQRMKGGKGPTSPADDLDI